MPICDLCGKHESAYAFTTLFDIYKTEDVKEICRDCTDEVNKHVLKCKIWHNEITQRFVKRYLRIRRKVHAAEAKLEKLKVEIKECREGA